MPAELTSKPKKFKQSKSRDEGKTYLSVEYKNRMGRLLKLTTDEESKIKKFCKRELDEWERDTSTLHQILQDNNDLVEGVIEESDWPWEGASNEHIPITAIYMKLYHSIEHRSILGSENIWYAVVDPEESELEQSVAEIEQAINWNAKERWNFEEAFSEVFTTTNRDGLGIMEVIWVEDYETREDVVLVANIQEFQTEFPTPDSLGMSEKEYKSLAIRINKTATTEEPLEIPIEYDHPVYVGPKGNVIELADFPIFPATATTIEESRGHGKRFGLRKGLVIKKGKDGLWYEEAVKKFKKHTRKGSGSARRFQDSQNRIEGLSVSGKGDDWIFYQLHIKIELKKGNGERKLTVTYFKEGNIVMAAIDYPYNIDNYALFRIQKRPNRLVGRSIPDDSGSLNREINTQHNQRINSRAIAEVPTFKGKATLKDEYERLGDSVKFRPGAIFWLKNPEAFEQFRVQPADLGQSMNEERNDMQLLDLLMGSAAALLSGRADPADPDAPGNKTETLIGQSNLRMDDPLNQIRLGVEQVGQIVISLTYQFGPSEIPYRTDGSDGQPERSGFLPKRLLRRGIRLKMSGVTVALNPDAELIKWLQYYKNFVQEPMIAQRPAARLAIMREALLAGRVKSRKKILPSDEEIQAEAVRIQKEAMKQLQQEQADEERKRTQQRIQDEKLKQDERLAPVKRQLEERNLAERLVSAESGL